MKTTPSKQRAFRPWPENVERLEYAEKIGLTLSDVANELIKLYGQDYLKKKTDALKKTLAAPVP